MILIATPTAAQAPVAAMPDLSNPFEDFQTLHLANGMKVWYRQLPNTGIATVAVSVPYGSDVDPPGREGAAHLLEHVLFADRAGRTEVQLRREIEDLGGTYNGHTAADRTVYHTTIGRDNQDVAIRWLYDVIAPRAITAAVVNRSREPAAIETGVRRSSLGRLGALFVSHPWLRPAGFWMREFGIETPYERDIDPYNALYGTTAADLRAFYDRYYVPSRMTLFIVGAAPLDSMRPLIDRTFGSLPERPEPPPYPAPRLREGSNDRYFWASSAGTDVHQRYRIAGLDGRERLHLLFIEDLLQRRLFEHLRLGKTPAAYGVSTGTVLRGRGAYFHISARLKPAHEHFARDIIDAEIARLRNASSDSSFEHDRDAIRRQLVLESGNAAALHTWLFWRLGTTELNDTFPDAGRYYATADADTISAFAARIFRTDNRVMSITRPLPLPIPALAVIAMMFAMLGSWVYRAIVHSPADMSRVLFIGRLRTPGAQKLLVGVITIIVGAAGLRMLIAAAHFTSDRWLLGIDSFAAQYGAAGVLLTLVTVTAFIAAGRVTRKIVVFEDEVRLKSITFGVRRIPAERIQSVSFATPRAARRRVRHLGGHRFGTRRTGVLIELAGGRGLLYYVRDAAGLMRSLVRTAPWAQPPSPGPLPVVQMVDEVVDAEDLPASVVIANEDDT